MHHTERLNLLLDKIRAVGRIRIIEEAEAMNVSISTLHRDLHRLAQRGVVSKIRGGAVFAKKTSAALSYDMRLKANMEEKREIARSAVRYISDNSSIFIDHSTSCAFLIQEILATHYQNLNIITNSLAAPLELLGKRGVQVLVTGGLVNTEYKACSGKWVGEFLRGTNVDQVFVSAGSISDDKGLMTQQPFIVEIYRDLLPLGSQINVLIDSSKFSKIQTFQVTPLSSSFRIFTDRNLPKLQQEMIAAKGCQIIQ